eukprot:1622011-Alexandrium_andersonii.AAC.1
MIATCRPRSPCCLLPAHLHARGPRTANAVGLQTSSLQEHPGQVAGDSNSGPYDQGPQMFTEAAGD